MPQDLASLNLTAADITALHAALATIRTTLGDRAVSLTPAQRRSLIKMGDKSRNFCEQALTGLQSNSSSLPADFELTELVEDMADFTALDTFFTDYQTLGETIDDTLKALSSDIMAKSIIGVTFLKALNKLKPSLDTLLKNLGTLRRSKAAKKPATP